MRAEYRTRGCEVTQDFATAELIHSRTAYRVSS